jgi:predicted O-methyltransferase YrrM
MDAWANLIRPALVSGRIQDDQGNELPFHSAIDEQCARVLHETVKRHKPKLALEIGMACGSSTVAILSALEPDASLISIDPFQHEQWKGVGVLNVQRSGYTSQHRLIEDRDYYALPGLLKDAQRVDFAYIDGWHTFEHILIDAFFTDKMLATGGVVGFNDCNLPSTHKALRWLTTHRHYKELNTGQKPDYRGRNILYTAARFLLRRPANDRYFQKIDAWEPSASYYKWF